MAALKCGCVHVVLCVRTGTRVCVCVSVVESGSEGKACTAYQNLINNHTHTHKTQAKTDRSGR